MTTSTPRPLSRLKRFRAWLPSIIVLIALVVILPQVSAFRLSLQSLADVDYGPVVVAVLATGATFIFGAAAYKLLAFKKLPFGQVLIAQVAANFVNRILPAGVGGIGMNYRYLRCHGHKSIEATSIVAANNSLGVIGHLLLVGLLSSVYHAHAVPVHLSQRTKLLISLIIFMILALIIILPRLRRNMMQSFGRFIKQLKRYKSKPGILTGALAMQMCLTLCNVTCFWLCAQALHLNISFVAALLIFTLGFSVGAAVPTPGGLGGVEAGLVAGLVAYHVSSSAALSAVLLYRLVSYWLPLACSGLVLIYASRRHYFG